MENKFQREERYLVIKTKDIAHLSDADRQMLRHLLQRIHIIRTERGAEPLHCVVVEDDWPEYGLVWGLIEYRMTTGKHAPIAPLAPQTAKYPAPRKEIEMKFRKKAVVIEAVQWFKDGDHPAVIRKADKHRYADIGTPWVPTLEGGHIVTPGDWIITGVRGEHYPCKPDVFSMTYEPENIFVDLIEQAIGAIPEDSWSFEIRQKLRALTATTPTKETP